MPAPQLIPCPVCRREVSSAALSCPHCGQILKAPKAERKPSGCGTILALGITGLFVVWAVGKCVGPSEMAPSNQVESRSDPATSPLQSSEPAPAPSPGSQWTYATEQDSMSGKSTYAASVLSTNTLNLGFPYSGSQRARLILRRHPTHGQDVILTIEKGQILCGYSDCPVRVRFDDAPARVIQGNEPADHDSTVVFLPGFKDLRGRIAKAKVMRVQVNLFQEGAPVLEFDVSGFDPSKLDPPKKK